MKRLILTIILAVLTALPSMAQDKTATILYDKVDRHNDNLNIRKVGTSSILCRNGFTDRHPFNLSMEAFQAHTENMEKLSYFVYLHFVMLADYHFEDGDKMLIKLSDDTIIEWEQSIPEYTSRISTLTNSRYDKYLKKTVYDVYAKYPVSVEDIEAICDKGVQKLRIEYSGGQIDIEYKKADKFSPALFACFITLAPAMTEKKDIYTDF